MLLFYLETLKLRFNIPHIQHEVDISWMFADDFPVLAMKSILLT